MSSSKSSTNPNPSGKTPRPRPANWARPRPRRPGNLPKRATPVQKPKQQPRKDKDVSPDKLLQAAGQRGTDIRAPDREVSTSVQRNLIVAGTVNTLPVVAEYTDRAVSYLAMGIVLHALKNGYTYSATIVEEIDPYNAFLRIIAVVKSAMNGAQPLVQQAPVWFWQLLQAVKPKSVPFKTGSIRYDWRQKSSGQGDDVAFSLGPAGEPDAYTLYWGRAGLTGLNVNGFNILTSPSTSEASQIESLMDLFGWFNSRYGQKLVQQEEAPGFMEKDTSAFAAVFPELASSYFSPGAVKTTLYSERQVDSPILSKFANYQPDQETASGYRGWQKGGVSAGSACYLGARLPELSDLNSWRNKTSPIIKFYNFDEFFDVLSLTLGGALENAAQMGIVIPPCPLTSQEVQIALRQSMLPFFSNEMAQDLRYEGVQGGFDALVPFVVGPNGVSSGNAVLNVPMFLAENIKCATRLTTCLKSRYGSKRQVQDIIPVLGRLTERSQIGNYTWGEGTPLYAVDPSEVPISLIDTLAVVGQSSYYLDLNGNKTAEICSVFNSWIQKLSNCLSGLTSLTPGPGCKALVTSIYTNLQIEWEAGPGDNNAAPNNNVAGRPPMKKADSLKQLGRQVKLLKCSTVQPAVGSAYFNNIGDTRLTAQLGIYEALAPFIKIMILPINKMLEERAITSFQSIQAFQVEPSFMERSSNNGILGSGAYATLPTAEMRHRLMAQIDLKTVGSDGDNEMIAGLKELDKQGAGGFFTAIADVIGQVTGLPLGPVARMITGDQ